MPFKQNKQYGIGLKLALSWSAQTSDIQRSLIKLTNVQCNTLPRLKI